MFGLGIRITNELRLQIDLQFRAFLLLHLNTVLSQHWQVRCTKPADMGANVQEMAHILHIEQV